MTQKGYSSEEAIARQDEETAKLLDRINEDIETMWTLKRGYQDIPYTQALSDVRSGIDITLDRLYTYKLKVIKIAQILDEDVTEVLVKAGEVS